jgi:hypothetical protein
VKAVGSITAGGMMRTAMRVAQPMTARKRRGFTRRELLRVVQDRERAHLVVAQNP